MVMVSDLDNNPIYLLGRLKEALIANNKVLDLHGTRKIDAHIQSLCDKLREVSPEVYDAFVENRIEEVYYRV